MPDLIPLNLLLCLRPDTDANVLAQLSREDWTTLLQQAKRFRVTPMLFRRILRQKPDIPIPPDVRHEISKAYYYNVRRNIVIYVTIAEALVALQDDGIPRILLKGVYLAEQIYFDIGLRPMADLDLMVPRPFVVQAIDSLKRAGFKSQGDYVEEVQDALQHRAPLMTKNGLILELHWSLISPGGPLNQDITGLWQRAVAVPLKKGSAQGLAPSDLLLHLCVHAAYSHGFNNRLYSLCDIAEVLTVKGSTLDWQAFNIATELWKAQKGVYLTLRLAVELVGAKVPPSALALLEPPDFNQQTLDWAKVQLFRTTPALSNNFNRLMRKGRIGERLRVLWKAALFPSPTVIALKYNVSPHSWRLMWLYPFNTATLITLYWRHAIKLLKKDPLRDMETNSNLNLCDWLDI
jgi:hypothetical protein